MTRILENTKYNFDENRKLLNCDALQSLGESLGRGYMSCSNAKVGFGLKRN